jgi:hypothetical protein
MLQEEVNLQNLSGITTTKFHFSLMQTLLLAQQLSRTNFYAVDQAPVYLFNNLPQHTWIPSCQSRERATVSSAMPLML